MIVANPNWIESRSRSSTYPFPEHEIIRDSAMRAAGLLCLHGPNYLNLTYLHDGRWERATVNRSKLIKEASA